MKKTVSILLFFFISISYSQNSIEKWNELKNRYEYFDSNGNMIAYKVYNSYLKQWETYNVETSVYSAKSAIDSELINQTLTEKQARYDYNLKKIKLYISECMNILYTSDMDSVLIQNIKDSFDKEYIVVLNKKNYDLSSNQLTTQIIEWLHSGFLATIKNETDKFNAKATKIENIEKPGLSGYIGGYNVLVVKEYIYENKAFKLVKTEKGDIYFYCDGDFVYFKKGENSPWLVRKIVFKSFDTKLNDYVYTSDYGSVHFDKYFKIVTFMDDLNPNKVIRKYEYTLGGYDEKIIPIKQ